MKVSVAFIAYNHEPFVAQALESVLMQEGVEFEVVVGEDRSTDRTREIVAGYAERNPGRIHLLPGEKNLGMHRNTERTLQACTGEYVALLEGDDYWTSPDKLRKQAMRMDRDPGCALCFHNVQVVYEDGRPSHPFRGDDSKTVFTAEELAAENFICTCSAMLRNRPPIPYPDWLLRMPMLDWPLFLLCAERGAIAYLPDRMGAYRVHAGGIWASLDRVAVLEKSLLASGMIREHLGGRYGKAMDRSVLRWRYEIDRILSDGKKPARAVPHAERPVAAPPCRPDPTKSGAAGDPREGALPGIAGRGTTPKVTVCIPAYNHGRYIGAAIESALGQTMREIEVVVSDDSSTDDTYRVAKRYADSDGRVRLHRNDANLGMVENWNVCLRHARGEYVKMLCSDDTLEPSCLERQARVLDEGNSVVLVSAARRLLDEEGAETGIASYADRFVAVPGTDAIIDCFRRVANRIGEPCAVLFRRAAASRGFHPAYRQLTDLEMWFHLLEQGDFVHLPEALCGFRRHAGQRTRANAESLAFADDEFRLFDDYSGRKYISLSRREMRNIRYNKALLVWNRRNRGGGAAAARRKISEHYPLLLFYLVTFGKRWLRGG